MVEVQIPEMMEVGAHYGHQTKRWNPKMRPYIFGARSGVHILDLQQTKQLANEALKFIEQTVANGRKVLFVGTKMQAREVIRDNAKKSQMHYVNNRWMGGTLTNFKTIKKSIDRLIDLETKKENNDFDGYTKKERLDIDRTIVKLEASLGGIKHLTHTPGVVFVVDPTHEHIAIREAQKLNIPIVALVDSNCDPDPVDLIIPSNDDALGSIAYFTEKVAEACFAGMELYEQKAQQLKNQKNDDQKKTPRRRVSQAEPTDKKAAFVDKAVVNQAAQKEEGVDSFSAKAEKAPQAIKKDAKVEEQKEETKAENTDA
ncbi:MAG: 30S ribosomal protein S2 [bacterium]|nr:30S ribosomal protein S2 [bacterium]MBU1917417.1 30S ribosomal protein S2 [bacterium]